MTKLNNSFRQNNILVCLLSLFGLFSLFLLANIKVIAIESINDQMLLKALNNSISDFFPSRGELTEILEADVPYVLKLNASGKGISDISGLEQFVYIQSTIDLSNNNINDIAPLINWVRNKNDKNLSANIFLGSNPVLSGDNYKQIYILSELGDNIRIYDSQRKGGGVVELTGFVNGRPVEEGSFDSSLINSENTEKKQIDVESSDVNQREDDIVNTGATTVFVYILSCFIVLLVLWRCIYRKA